jgi:2-succinyl-5-enolpyruvyl-6-hydroxy-3-cyclohexene-1-carboxylate synthase
MWPVPCCHEWREYWKYNKKRVNIMSVIPTDKPDFLNPTYVYIGAFVDELQRAGVHNVVICPGSRSTPLAMVLASQNAIHTWMHIDERSAAFFALGMAKRLAQPVALVCTSGTAAANFFPALVEAHLTHVPLLVLTADRPHELRDNGAPQAIDQNRLYGTHVKWFVDVALPEANNSALRYIRTLANRAVALTCAAPAGPVHLNMPLREPLIPDAQPDQPLPPLKQRDPVAWQGRPANAPYIAVTASIQKLKDNDSQSCLLANIHTHPRGLIIVGPCDDPDLPELVTQLAQRSGYPILADPLSQLRSSSLVSPYVSASYDAFLRIDAFVERVEPQLIMRFGAMPTSKPLLLYLKRYASCLQIVIDGNASWEEPTQLASEMIHTDPVALCRELLSSLSDVHEHDPQWIETWQQAEQRTRQGLLSAIQDFGPLFEGRVFTELAALLPPKTTLYVGNSMPVRDLDTFFWQSTSPLRIMGNRGANGIDGMISSALGASAVNKEGPTVLVIGDLSFFHDLNGLLAARLHQLDLTIVLINNDGGGIFSFLPQAAYPEHFEQLFGTPTGLDFAPVVQMYGGSFQRVSDWHTFRSVLNESISSSGLHVIEVPTMRDSNVQMHRQLWQVVGNAIHK